MVPLPTNKMFLINLMNANINHAMFIARAHFGSSSKNEKKIIRRKNRNTTVYYMQNGGGAVRHERTSGAGNWLQKGAKRDIEAEM